jgi:hypothetical protein
MLHEVRFPVGTSNSSNYFNANAINVNNPLGLNLGIRPKDYMPNLMYATPWDDSKIISYMFDRCLIFIKNDPVDIMNSEELILNYSGNLAKNFFDEYIVNTYIPSISGDNYNSNDIRQLTCYTKLIANYDTESHIWTVNPQKRADMKKKLLSSPMPMRINIPDNRWPPDSDRMFGF